MVGLSHVGLTAPDLGFRILLLHLMLPGFCMPEFQAVALGSRNKCNCEDLKRAFDCHDWHEKKVPTGWRTREGISVFLFTFFTMYASACLAETKRGRMASLESEN